MRFIESICFEGGCYQHLDLHQDRVTRTCLHFFGEPLFQLADILPDIKLQIKQKVRFVYGSEGYTCEYAPYQKKVISTLSVIKSDWFDYSFKYENRDAINELVSKTEADEILISIDGKITDSSYANVAFWNGDEWLTPETPLLEGVRRQHLLSEKTIRPASIEVKDLGSFEKVALINAMLDLGALEIPVSALQISK